MWTVYFEEIKKSTKGIQDKLKKGWYEDIDLELKSLFVDWIEFFLSLSTDEPQLDNDKWKYLKGLFDVLGINISNKRLLEEIKSELKNWWEKLPPSPLEFLVHGRVIYHVWNEYIPLNNHWNSINLLWKLQCSSFEELVEMYAREQKDFGRYLDLTELWKTRKAIITYIKSYFLNRQCIDFKWMYENWDRFEVVRDTYKGTQPCGHEEISGWYVNVCSQKTWKVYRVLSI